MRFIRPFPKDAVKELPSEVLVVDRANTGIYGILGLETSACGIKAKNVVAGIGGFMWMSMDFTTFSKSSLAEKLKEVEWLI